ncbi:hypothetical protein EVG20_g1411 [Dentipellis fragilis]|uniref:Uncharacterized protein n=1 Tax=Dentipellis fragilis TaxID=205917 RepID=A0A4Y9ZDW4_9AGAM|nr:hypothetical protein EVG20_g1411 [Dentipellis fragilis]
MLNTCPPEMLRLFPAVPFNMCSAINDIIWPSKVPSQLPFIPASMHCVYSVFMMHHCMDLWGPDGALLFCPPFLCVGWLLIDILHSALEFDLDHFIDACLGKYLMPNPFIFVPFNASPCICLRQQVHHIPFPSSLLSQHC